MKLKLDRLNVCMAAEDKHKEERICNCPLIWSGLMNVDNYNPLGTLLNTLFIKDITDPETSPCGNIDSLSECPLRFFIPDKEWRGNKPK